MTLNIDRRPPQAAPTDHAGLLLRADDDWPGEEGDAGGLGELDELLDDLDRLLDLGLIEPVTDLAGVTRLQAIEVSQP